MNDHATQPRRRTARHIGRRAVRRGLTMVELVIGSAMLGMIMLALASFSSAISTGWRHSRDLHHVADTGTRVGEQVQTAMTNMLAVVYNKAGSTTSTSDAYVFYWANDAYGGTADGQAQFGEMGLLEYRAATKSIYLYAPKSESAMTSGQKARAATSNWGTASTQSDRDSIVAYFKSSGVAATPTQLAGPDADGHGSTVDATALNVFTPSGAKPMVMYDLTVTDPVAKAAGQADASTRSFGTATMRAWKSPTNITN